MSQPASEHRLRLRLESLAAASVLLAITLICMAASLIFLYLAGTGRGWRLVVLWALPAAGFATLLGYATWRYISRVLSIRCIRLIAPATIELHTRRGNLLRAELPESIERVILIGNEITLHLKVGTHRLIISPEEFTESATINTWLQTSGLKVSRNPDHI
jgi:hypothetical protein